MSGHVDSVSHEVMVTMRDHMKQHGPSDPRRVDSLTDAEVLAAFDRDYPQGARGFMDDVGAGVDR